MLHTTGWEFAKPDWLLITAVLAAFAGAWALRASRRPASVALPRLLFLGLALVLLLQPVLVRYARDSRPLIAVAFDVSRSMKLAGRSRAAQEFAEGPLAALRRQYRMRFYTFATATGETSGPSDLERLSTGESTDIGRSLWEIRRETGEELSGIVLLSDGNHNAGPLEDQWVRELGVPVFAVAPGAAAAVRDLAVNSLRVGDFAFKDTPVELSVGLSATGFSGRTAAVALREDRADGRIIAQKAVTIASDRERAELALRFTPGESGVFTYRVEITPLPGEVTLSNNRREFTLEVIREKVRVLYLCGQPGPEYSFLRHTLKNDPLVELVSFVILRNPENIALVPETDLALIPFPVNDIFTREINTFDALILENFTYRKFGFLPEYLENIRSWVTKKGGGLIMIAGDNAFGRGGWAETPLAEIMPVVMDHPGEAYEEDLFKPRVETYDHPLMRLDGDPSKNRALWAALPELAGCQALKPRPGAELLAAHPWKQYAVLAGWDRGRGRVVALGSNTTWRWSLQSTTPEHYTDFWKNMVRYLTRSQEARRWHLSFDRPAYYAGQHFTVRVRGPASAGTGGIALTYLDASGKRHDLDLSGSGTREWTGQGDFAAAGVYRFRLRADGESITDAVNVSAAAVQEEVDLGINETLLRRIAELSGGACIEPQSFSPERIGPQLRRSTGREIKDAVPLWHSPWFFAAACILLFGEWLLRRSKGLW